MSDPSDRLKQARIDAGYESAPAAAAVMGVPAPTYMSHENGTRGFAAHAKRYATLFKTTPEWLLFGSSSSPATPARLQPTESGAPVNLEDLRRYIQEREKAPGGRDTSPRMRSIQRSIPVMGEVAAGLWREAMPRTAAEAEEHLPIDVPGYERAQLYALKVTGPSMDLVYPPGRFVVVAHPAEAGLRVGDYVVVERHKADLVEITVKEFTVSNGRLILLPRSTHPDHQQPIYLRDNGEQDQTSPVIVGVVVADYSRRERPQITFDPSMRKDGSKE